MPSVLYTASTFSHILNFHLPYLRRFRELGWQVEVACGGPLPTERCRCRWRRRCPRLLILRRRPSCGPW